MKSILCGLSTDIFLKFFVFKSSRECNNGNPQGLAASVYDNFRFSLIKGYIYPFVFFCLYLLRYCFACDIYQVKTIVALWTAHNLGDECFFFLLGLKKYLTTGNFYSLRKNTISSADLREMDIEDILDLTYLIGTLSVYPDYIIFCEDQVDLNFKDCQFLLEKCFCSNNPYLVLKFLDEIKLLPKIFPFLYHLKGIEQDRLLHPEGDVFDHTLNCFQFIKAPSLELFYGLLLHVSL